ncbi:MAG: CoA-transferase [Rhodospirillales bacterium]
MSEIAREELLVSVIADMLQDLNHVAVGALSPIPGAAALLARARSGKRLRVSLLGSQKHNPFTDGGKELFDCAAQGRIDAFFLSGGQIDGEGNINLVGVGDYPDLKVRWNGSFGSTYLYFLVPRVILFREEHTPRVFVPKVDFISAPGTSDPATYRTGGPHALVTGRCVFGFDKANRRFRLDSVHEGETPDSVREATGFDYESPDAVPPTPAPSAETLSLLRGQVAEEIAETYPEFAARLFGKAAA